MSATLSDRIAARIAAAGPITWAEFMEFALYDSVDGFFTRPSVGREFVTSVHISSIFASLIGRLLDACFQSLSRPGDFKIIDLGAGDGTLTRALHKMTPYEILPVERGAHARTTEVAGSIDEVPSFTGVVIANELFDNIPFHRVRDGREVFVDSGPNGFVETLLAPTVECAHANDGKEWIISPQSEDLIRSIAKVLKHGYVFAIDYGYVSGEDHEPVRAYAGHRMNEDVLMTPGAQDITGPVDFDRLAHAATDAGFQVFGPITQRDFLMNLGYRRAVEELRARQREDEKDGNWRDAIAGFGARGEATMLVDLDGLGALKVIAFATDGLPAPLALQSRTSLA